jgi:carbon-monoxide dehydrogenase large subunit
MVFDQDEGKLYVKGSPDQSLGFGEVSFAAYAAHNLPEGMEPGLEAHAYYDPANFTYPFAAHIAQIEVDRDTGEVTLQRYIGVDDCGVIINPMIVEGQVMGGVVQSIGQVLLEQAVYDENGQLLTGSMMDYALPRADDVPNLELGFTETPSPVNPLGVKGIGEMGTIVALPTIANAVMDALAPLGIKHLDTPLTSEKVWQAIQSSENGG